ncbi:MAG: hypothetical protein QNJ16_20060 [Rhodobacter sp.]|nr:hypothetical protein [Rhodobacter sp.]
MSYTIEIDDSSLQATAKALETLNPGRSSADRIRDVIRANMWDGSTSISTLGWEACGFFPKHKPGVMVVRVSVSAFVVNRYLDRLVNGDG